MADISAILAKGKDALALVNKARNMDLYQKVVDLYQDAITLAEQNAQLSARNRELEDAWEIKEKLRRDGPFFYLEGESDPICPRCWEVDRRIVHLILIGDMVGGTRRDCLNPTFPRWSRKHRLDDSSTPHYHEIGIDIHFTPGVHPIFLLGERIGAGFSGYDDAAMRPGVNFPLDLDSGHRFHQQSWIVTPAPAESVGESVSGWPRTVSG